MGMPELILNLWYVTDDIGVIYSLRMAIYLLDGTDEEKLNFLREKALVDYVSAEEFAIPERFHIQIGEKGGKMPVFHCDFLETLDSPLALFEDAIVDMDADLALQTDLRVSDNPLFCITPLLGNDRSSLTPNYSKIMRY